MRIVDLRSDTVTLPSPEMREAMAGAIVGDDVFREDPTVNRLEEEAALLVGKESALFVPSGTMGNQIAILTHTGRGDEMILDAQSHIYYYEVGASAMWAGVMPKPVQGLLGNNGHEVLQGALRQPDIHFPGTRLLCLENTFNRGGGTFMDIPVMKRIFHMAKEASLAVHLDGARIFNAATALRKDPRELTVHCDSVMFCLSKGLGAPVGSILAGERPFIEKARKYRKALGGGMRQAGILAAAGLVALKNIDRLAEDHHHARMLAEGLAGLPEVFVNLESIQTNMVIFGIRGFSADEITARMADRGIRCLPVGTDVIRMVTHLGISKEDVQYTLKAVQSLLHTQSDIH